MRDETAYQIRPLPVVPRWRDIGLVMKNSLLSRSDRAGHKAQLDEWLHADRQQEVEYLIDVKERIEELVVVADESAHLVGKQSVEAHVLKAKLVVTLF